MELGGNAPFLVFDDADLDATIDGAMIAKMRNGGQACTAANRFYAQRGIAPEFSRRLAEAMTSTRMGPGADPGGQLGPLVNAEAVDKVDSLVAGAVSAGARAIAGGTRPDGPGFYYPPTVLADVPSSAELLTEEIFGPVAPIVVVGSEEEALKRANDSNFGLGASVWTRDRAKGERIARRIESGMVWINDHSYSHGAAQCSWGGVKESGVGRSHSKFGMYECVNIKLVAWEPGLTRNFWWQPYDETLGIALRSSARILYGRSGQRFKALREGLVPLAKVGRKTLRKGE
jgi:succinate-semialdehyde dehydrogenase/glutarate-semialdehyde dehydrogenase